MSGSILPSIERIAGWATKKWGDRQKNNKCKEAIETVKIIKEKLEDSTEPEEKKILLDRFFNSEDKESNRVRRLFLARIKV